MGFALMFIVTLVGMLAGIISQTPWAAAVLVPWAFLYFKLATYVTGHVCPAIEPPERYAYVTSSPWRRCPTATSVMCLAK